MGGVCAAALLVIAMIIWQGVTAHGAHGAPDPTQPNTSPTVAFLDIGVLVFREGLECILVLAAITASMTGSNQPYRRPVAVGAGIAFVATLEPIPKPCMIGISKVVKVDVKTKCGTVELAL